MGFGDALLVAGILFSIASAVTSFPRIGTRHTAIKELPTVFSAAAVVFLSSAFALLVNACLSSDSAYRYVWSHSSDELTTMYKLSSVWAGGEGSLLLCAWFMSLILLFELPLRPRARTSRSQFRSVLIAVLSLMTAAFASMALMSGVFEETTESELLSYPDGIGMDILLQTPEMVLHAPLIFGAYAALSAVFAVSVTYHLTGEAEWHRTGLAWGRLGWVLLTAGICLGAVWAYYVIGWGGYWSWDPVETASLVPWFMATAFLHTLMRRPADKEYPIASPAFGMLSMVGVVFVSFVVRAGGLWSSSVHDYGASSSSSAVSRMVTLLQEEPSVTGTFAFMMALVIVTVWLSLRARIRLGPPREASRVRRFSELIADRNNMALAVTLLAATALVAMLLMFANIESDQAETFVELNEKMSVLLVALMTAMSLCLVWRLVGRERALMLILSLIGLSIALAVVGVLSDSVNGLVAFSLPSSVVAIAASVVRILQSASRGPMRSRIFRSGAQVAHLGVALLLLSFVVSSNLQSYPVGGHVIGLPVNAQLSVGDYTVHLVSLEISDDVSSYPAVADQLRIARVDVYENGKLVADDAAMHSVYRYDLLGGYELIETVPFVMTSLTEDLYLSFEWMSDEVALVHAKVVPMMTGLWTGMVLLAAGLVMRMAASDRGRWTD